MCSLFGTHRSIVASQLRTTIRDESMAKNLDENASVGCTTFRTIATAAAAVENGSVVTPVNANILEETWNEYPRLNSTQRLPSVAKDFETDKKTHTTGLHSTCGVIMGV